MTVNFQIFMKLIQKGVWLYEPICGQPDIGGVAGMLEHSIIDVKRFIKEKGVRPENYDGIPAFESEFGAYDENLESAIGEMMAKGIDYVAEYLS